MLFSLVAWFVAITFLAVIPSWWLYKADAIGWRSSFWLFKLRDIIASALYGTAFLVLLLTPFFMQTLAPQAPQPEREPAHGRVSIDDARRYRGWRGDVTCRS